MFPATNDGLPSQRGNEERDRPTNYGRLPKLAVSGGDGTNLSGISYIRNPLFLFVSPLFPVQLVGQN